VLDEDRRAHFAAGIGGVRQPGRHWWRPMAAIKGDKTLAELAQHY
jgi:hypothetical protein